MAFEKFLQYIRYEKRYSEHTGDSYQTDLEQFKKYFEETKGEGFSPQNVETKDVRNWMISLMKEGEKPTTINRKLSAMKSYYRYLKRQGEVKRSPLVGIVSPKKEERLPVFVRESSMEELLDGDLSEEFGEDFDGVRNKLMIDTFYTLGLRRAELIGLKDGDVDLSGKVVKILGKGNKERYVPFDEPLKESIENYLRKRETVEEGEGYFFRKSDGRPLYPMMVWRIVNKYLTMLGQQQKKSPHVLRHSFATAMLNNGAEINAVKELLGHSSLAATQIYTHLTVEQLQKIYKQAHPRA